jgi:hypothetical protein
MRYLCVYKSERDASSPPTEDEITKMGRLIGEMTQAGVLLATEGCKSSKHGARLTISAAATLRRPVHRSRSSSAASR